MLATALSESRNFCSCAQPHSALGFACCWKIQSHSRACRGCPLKRYAGWLVVAAVFFSGLTILQARAQVDHIVIAAGTDEANDLQAISNAQDPQNKVTMSQHFVP